MTVFKPLRDRAFRNFWMGMSLSTTGYWMQTIIVTWLMQSWSRGDAVQISLVQTAMFLPIMLMSLPAGVLSDRLDRRKLLIGVHLFMAVSPLCIAGLVFMRWESPAMLLGLVVLLAFGNAVKLPSQSAYLPDLTTAEHLPSALSLSSMALNGGRIVGPAIAGLLLPGLGAATVLFANSASYLAFVAVLLGLQDAPQRKTGRGRIAFAQEIGGLFRFVHSQPAYRAILVRGGLLFATWPVVLIVLPILARDATAFGTIYLYFGIGAIIGAIFVAHVRNRLSPSGCLALAIGAHAISVAILPLWESMLVQCAATFMIGMAAFLGLNTFQISVQKLLPPEIRGRGLALMNMVFMGSTAVASPLWGAIVKLSTPLNCNLIAAAFSLTALGLTSRLRIDPNEPVTVT